MINCQNSLCIKSWELWSKGFGIDYISKELKTDQSTVRRWLKRGKESGIINYSEKESRDRIGILYKVIDQYENEMYLYGNKVWNANRRKGFLDISFNMFKKYIEPYGIININNIEEGTFTNTLRKKLAPFNGTRFIKIEKYSMKQLKNINQQVEKSNLPLVLDYVHGINFDLNEVWRYCQNSLCVKSWGLWRKGFGIGYISKELKVYRRTVTKWLKRGKKSGIINYSEKESIERRGTLYKVIDQYRSEMYLYGNKVWNANGHKGFLDLEFNMFKKYIEPYGIIDINKIESDSYKKN